MARQLSDVGWRAAVVGLAVLAAGFAAVLAASIQAMAAYPGSSLVDGYWIGLLPLMGLGPWLILVGATVAGVGGLVVTLAAGPAIARVAAVALAGVAAFWWFGSLAWAGTRCLPTGVCSANDVGAIAYSRPQETLLLLVFPALLIGVLDWRAGAQGRARR